MGINMDKMRARMEALQGNGNNERTTFGNHRRVSKLFV